MPFAGIPATFPHVSVGATLVTFAGLEIGYAEDRVMIDERPQWEDIRNDAFGGMAGVPSDIQLLGEVIFVQANINRFSPSNMESLALIAPNFGGPANIGDLAGMMGVFARQDGLFEPLVLSNKTATLTFANALLRHGRKFNLGTRHQQVALVFECHVDDPCDMSLWVASTADDPCS
jgi:hypothetical protein